MVLHHLFHSFWIELVVHSFAADTEGQCGQVNVCLVFSKSFKSKDNVLALKVSYGGPKRAGESSNDDGEG